MLQSPLLGTKYISYSNFIVLVLKMGELGPSHELGKFSKIMETQKSTNVDWLRELIKILKAPLPTDLIIFHSDTYEVPT